MLLIEQPSQFFFKAIEHTSLREETKAYVAGVLRDHISHNPPRSGSAVLDWIAIHENPNFESYQRLADGILWVSIILPERHQAFQTVNENIARQAYSRCYVLVNRTWPVFERLADELPKISSIVAQALDGV